MKKASSGRLGSEAARQNAAFGQAIYQLRIKAEMSQEELALGSNVGRSYVGVLERGEKEPCLGVVFRLAKALNVKVVDLFGLAEQLYESGYKPRKQNARVR